MANYVDPLTKSNAGGPAVLQRLRIAFVGPVGGDDALLSRMGAQVSAFSSGEDAFASLLERDFDLVLVHLQLGGGGIGGPEFVRLVRSCGHPLKSQIPIIGLANARQLQFADRLRSTGVSALLSTPIDVAQFNVTIAKLIGAAQSIGVQDPRVPTDAPDFSAWSKPAAPAVEAGRRATHRPAPAATGRPSSPTTADPMQQRMNFPQAMTTPTPAVVPGANDHKGLLERLGDKILARLAKTSGGPGEQPPALEAVSSPRAGAGESTPFLSAVAATGTARRERAEPAPVRASREASPPAPTVQVRHTSAPAPIAPSAPAPLVRPQSQPAPRRTATATKSSPDQLAGASLPRQPYVSRIHRRPITAAAPEIETLAAQNGETPSYRLSDAEKSRVYERVRKLVSTARRTAQESASPPTAADGKIPQPRQRFKVCFLEDSCTSSHAIREMLGEAGHEVDHFSSAEEALDALVERDYDVLLASQIVALGGMDCVGLIETIRRLPDPKRRLMPVVAITANSDPANIESFYVAGASDVVVKPIEGNELNKRIGQALASQPALETQNDSAPRLSVCFLEDSCTSSHAIREMLGEHGHEVDHFSSPEEALDALSEKRYDLLLASQIVALGGMDCEQLVKTMRSSPKAEQRNLPILVITANPDPANVQKFYAAGANDVAIKPIEGKALNERVREVVQVKATPMPLAAPPVLPAPPRNLHVCFLEDSCTSSHAIREMLGEAGHEVDHFSTPEEALDAFLEKDYDVLLASQLPSLGGLDTAGLVGRVRAAGGARASKPVVLLTTDPSAENQQRFRRSGVNDIVIKPVEGNLSQRLQDVVARFRGGATPAAAPRRAPVVVPEHLKVCFLEDSCTSSHAIREMLGEAGHEVDHFSSPEEALDAFMEKPYDVMLASQIVALGGLDCEGMIRAIRGASQTRKRQVPLVAITANGDAANVESLKRAGADAVIIKPIEGDLGAQLKQVVGRVLGQPAASRPQLRVVPNGAAGVAPAAQAAAPRATSSKATPSAAPGAVPKPTGPAPSTPSPAKLAPGTVATAPTAAPIFNLKPEALPSATQPNRATTAGGRERRIVLAVAAAGLMAVVVSTWHHFGEAIPVDVIAVEQGPIFETINAPGQVVSKKRVELTTAIAGQIVKVAVKEGDTVKKGQILATLDDRDAMIQIQRADANLDSAKKDVALTERTLDRLVRALQMGAVSRQMAEDAEAAVHAARAKQRVAAEEARAAELMAERLNVIAPFDGVVTVSYAVDGLWAEPPGPLFQLVDMTQREVELKIPAEQVSRLNAGQAVNLSSEAFPGHQWTEQIVRVAPATSREQGMANTLSVYATLGPDAPPLRFGQQVDAQIRTAGNERAVRVPLGAVTVQNGRPVVAVIDEGHVRFKPVATGIESFSHIEIRNGLKPGDQVILLNKPLEDGAKVEPVELPG